MHIRPKLTEANSNRVANRRLAPLGFSKCGRDSIRFWPSIDITSIGVMVSWKWELVFFYLKNENPKLPFPPHVRTTDVTSMTLVMSWVQVSILAHKWASTRARNSRSIGEICMFLPANVIHHSASSRKKSSRSICEPCSRFCRLQFFENLGHYNDVYSVCHHEGMWSGLRKFPETCS